VVEVFAFRHLHGEINGIATSGNELDRPGRRQ
jgi:hypothetical protein